MGEETPPPTLFTMDDKTREYIVALALKFQGTPYIWGGSVPYNGFDCSGFVIWVLQVFGILPSGDWTAASLSETFPRTETPKPGALCFYGKETRITHVTHVMMYIGNEMCVGASGGGSECTTVEIARSKGAQVKVKTVKYRGDFLFYCEIGNGNPNTNT